MQIYYDTAAVYACKPFIGGPHTGLTGQWTEATTAERRPYIVFSLGNRMASYVRIHIYKHSAEKLI